MEKNEILEQQRQTWNKFSSGWKKWDNLVLPWLKPVGDELIKAVDLKEDYTVLDFATGTGEPGLTAAMKVTRGKVIGQDVAEQMLSVAKENAKLKNIKNYETVTCDISHLPFPANYFDAVIGRFGFMFFPDMQDAAKEMIRVLKPGKKLATSVWASPEKNPWATTIMGTVNQLMEIPPPPDGAPGLFRCAMPGMIATLFKNSGLKNVEEKEVSGMLTFESVDGYWNFMNEIAAPVVAAMSNADEKMKEKIKTAVIEKAQTFNKEGKLTLPWCAIVISGEK